MEYDLLDWLVEVKALVWLHASIEFEMVLDADRFILEAILRSILLERFRLGVHLSSLMVSEVHRACLYEVVITNVSDP